MERFTVVCSCLRHSDIHWRHFAHLHCSVNFNGIVSGSFLVKKHFGLQRFFLFRHLTMMEFVKSCWR